LLNADFEIPSRSMAGKSALNLKIEYVRGKNLEWEEYYNWIYSFK